MTVDRRKLEVAACMILEAIGEEPFREGLKDTPKRFGKMWAEFIDYEPGTMDTVFESIHLDQMVAVSGVRVWSICEHHLLPFSCDLTIGYLTVKRVIGLSKMARIAHFHAHGLQCQERLVDEIATDMMGLTGSNHVAVIGRGNHLCMTMRGIRTPHIMVSSAMRGQFKDDPSLRSELLQLTKEN